MKQNKFKAALKRGDIQLGIWSTIPDSLVAEALAQSGFDWVLFDAEHTPIEIAGLMPLLQAADNGEASAVVRPPWTDQVLIKRTLDIGAQTLLLPFVQSAAEAERAVRSMQYPLSGVRGVAGSTRASSFGRDTGYLKNASNELCTLVQVETGEALAQLEAIAAVEGVDGVFIGPSDLSASMGHLGNPGADVVQEAIKQAAGRIRDAGKAPGILAVNIDDAKRYIDWGYQFVACNVDLRLLVQSVDQLHRDMRG